MTYRVLRTIEHDGETYSLIRVTLGTGRSHQIRCQLSHHGTPILCDGKYGGHRPQDADMPGIALWSYHLAFVHPANMPAQDRKKEMPQTARMQKRGGRSLLL